MKLQKSSQCLLVILDGFGIREDKKCNAIKLASTPHIDYFLNHFPNTLLEAGGEEVGLPKGVAGNSEVGHMNIGSGRAVEQDLVGINRSIAEGTLEGKEKLKEFISLSKKGTKRVHLLGLLSDGGVHSHIDHLKEFIKIFSNTGLQVFYHAFMDGRDTPPQSGESFLKDILTYEDDSFHLASIQGRSIGMDRDRRWEKIEISYRMLTGDGKITNLSPYDYLKNEYGNGIFDEFITPALFDKNYAIQEEDFIFFLNFRPDRAAQLTLAFMLPDFEFFNRKFIPPYFLCMTPYVQDEITLPILFEKSPLEGGLSEILSNKGFSQFKIAETEKFAHVTYFFNGGQKDPFDLEERLLIPSPKDVSTYDQKPEMSAKEVNKNLLKALETDTNFYLVNFANGDMVGHTGNLEAAIKAIECLDDCLGKLFEICKRRNIPMIITADHGNADQMCHADGGPHTSHTISPVPFIFIHESLKDQKQSFQEGNYSLKDIAPTVLTVFGIEIPKYFTGKTIFNLG